MFQLPAKGVIIAVLTAAVAVFGYLAWSENRSFSPTPQPVPLPDLEDQDTFSSVSTANNTFGLDLYSEYRAEQGNLFFSPYSISSALAMTYEGAAGETADEMRTVLRLTEDTEQVREGFSQINNRLNKEDKSYDLTTANSLWGQEDYPFAEDYLATVEEYYGGKLTNLDFKNNTEEARKTINLWVESKTEDRIKNLISKGVLNSLTRLVLTNAIYFKSDWENQFDSKKTEEAEFTLNSGETVSVEMMHKTAKFNFAEDEVVKVLEMPYEDGELSMLVVLPKENDLSAVEKFLTRDKFDDWLDNLKQEEVVVTFPKFKYETKYQMANTLESMGMVRAFDAEKADFSGLTGGENDLFIDKVIHQTFIEVDEAGTEAAAATAVTMMTTSLPEEEPKIFEADHPFVFLIKDNQTDTILFLGRISNPS
ncbi:MAG: serpin family protein [Patescibacteria group bacterium]